MEKRKIIYGVVGVQNTGKTTFISDILNMDNNLFVINNNNDYRKNIDIKNIKINRDGNEESQKIIFNCLKQNLYSSIESLDMYVISDRTVLDALIYTKWLQLHGKNHIDQDTIYYMWNTVSYLMQFYTRIIWFPLSLCNNVNVVNDKHRDIDEQYRIELDNLYTYYLTKLSEYSLNTISIVHGSREERIKMLNLYYKMDTIYE